MTLGKDSIRITEIQNRVCQRQRSYTEDEIMTELEELSSAGVNIIRYDSNSDGYSISTPFWGAFLKMQLALEEANRNKFKNKNKRHKLILKNQNDIDADVYNVLLERIEEFRKC